MKKPLIYITSRSFGKHCKKALDLIEMFAETERNPYGRAMSKKELLEVTGDVDGIIVGNDKIGPEILENCKKLKIIARHGVGCSNINLEAATERKIVVAYTPKANSISVADFTIGLILSCARKIPQAHISVSQGRWESNRFLGMELCGKTIGIIGLGAIGKLVVRRIKGFDMNILYYSKPREKRLEKVLGIKYVNLETLLTNSDIVTLHVPLTKETRNMISLKELKIMKKTSFLINTGRGPLVDESALYESLKARNIAGAAIDVYSNEPPNPDFPLFHLENVIASPHIAAYTREAISRMDLMNAEDLSKFFRGGIPKYVANKEVLDRILLEQK